jgi:hypothetical protein
VAERPAFEQRQNRHHRHALGGRHALLAASAVDGFDAVADLWGGGVVMARKTCPRPARSRPSTTPPASRRPCSGSSATTTRIPRRRRWTSTRRSCSRSSASSAATEELKAGLAGGTSPGDVRSHDIAGPDAWEPAARRRRARSCQGRHARSGRGRPEVSAPGIVPPVAPEPRLPGAGPLLGLQPHAPGLSGCGVGWCVLRRIWPCGRASVVPSRCRMKVQFHR